MADTPNNIPASFAALQGAFLPEKAGTADKSVQFDFSGREAGTWHARVSGGQFTYGEGPIENPTATLAADSDDWLKILGGELNPVSAFMGGKVKIKGDMTLLMQFQSWFAQ